MPGTVKEKTLKTFTTEKHGETQENTKIFFNP